MKINTIIMAILAATSTLYINAIPITANLLAKYIYSNNIEEIKKLTNAANFKKIVNLPASDGEPALHWAALKGYLNIVKVLLDNGANPNELDKDGHTPLHSVAIKKLKENRGTPLNNNPGVRKKITELLIEKGASTTAGKVDIHGYAPLHTALFQENIEVIKVLLANGALKSICIPAKNDWTPYAIAHKKAVEGNTTFIKLIAGAMKNSINY